MSIANIIRSRLGPTGYPHGGIGGHGGILGLDEGFGLDPTALPVVGEVGNGSAAAALPEATAARHAHHVNEVGYHKKSFIINDLPTNPTWPTGYEPVAGTIEGVATAAHEPVGDVDAEAALEIARMRKQWWFVYWTAMKGSQGRASAMRAAHASCVAFWLETHPGATAEEADTALARMGITVRASPGMAVQPIDDAGLDGLDLLGDWRDLPIEPSRPTAAVSAV